MKREFLNAFELDDDVVDKIMAESIKDIEREKGKATTVTTERDTLQTQLADVQEQLRAFEGVDVAELQGKITTLSTDLEATRTTHAAELAKLTRQQETRDFLTGLKFVNDETCEFYAAKLEAALDDDANRGKGRKEILDSLTNGKDGKPRANIFADSETPNPVLTIPSSGGGPDTSANLWKTESWNMVEQYVAALLICPKSRRAHELACALAGDDLISAVQKHVKRGK